MAGIVGWVGWTLWPPEASQFEHPLGPAPPAAEAPAVATVTVPPPQIEFVELRHRDTLGDALLRGGLAAAEAHALAAGLREAGANLRRMRAGERIELARDAAGRPVSATYAPSAWQRFHASRGGDGWKVERTDITPEIRTELRDGEIRSSLWDAVDSGAVSANTILDMVQIFESSFDFAADAQPGDRFRLLVEARYADGRYVEDGRILAARYLSGSDSLAGVAFEVAGKTAYYDLDGRSMKKTFLRSPLQFTRISSGFTHRRPHPVLGGVRPHLAIDYAAPTGTPVWAVADGAVEFAGRKGGNGIQVLLRHRSGYKTYYNHLSRVAKGVRPGAKVAQKQVIGYVGSTGLSTGPHLDYRVSVNGAFVNPLSEKFLPGEPVPGAQREQFAMHAQALLDRLDAPAVPAAQPSSAGESSARPEAAGS